ncbi:unnamed protein product [Amoebophrya sp. A120]|nr:unnamed protein product [Amoebophrya sp. A120]|eukprot:GSA120T00004266001.1
MYPVERGRAATEQRFAYRQHELHDEEVPSDDDDDASMETRTFSFLVIGDQNAGKSTFLHSFSRFQDVSFTRLQSFLPTITSSFVNRCYHTSSDHDQDEHGRPHQGADIPHHPETGDQPLDAARHVEDEEQKEQEAAIKQLCDEPPYLDTDLGTATAVLTAEAFAFFAAEFDVEVRPPLSVDTSFVQLRFHEIGGDHLDRMMAALGGRNNCEYGGQRACGTNRSENDMNKSATSAATQLHQNPSGNHMRDLQVQESFRVLQKVTKLVYFVNASNLRGHTQDEDSATGNPACDRRGQNHKYMQQLEERLAFLGKLCTKCRSVVFYCSRIESDGQAGSAPGDARAYAIPLPERTLAAATVEQHQEGGHNYTDEAFAGISSLDPFREEYGEEAWQKEKASLLRLHGAAKFRTLREALILLSRRPGFLPCEGVYATRNLDENGSTAVCSIVVLLVRLLRQTLDDRGEQESDHAKPKPLEDGVGGANKSTELPQTTEKEKLKEDDQNRRQQAAFEQRDNGAGDLQSDLPEFVELLVACCVHYRTFVSPPVHYLSEQHWKRFLADKLVVSPSVPAKWPRFVPLLARTGLAVTVTVQNTFFIRLPVHAGLFDLLTSDAMRRQLLRAICNHVEPSSPQDATSIEVPYAEERSQAPLDEDVERRGGSSTQILKAPPCPQLVALSRTPGLQDLDVELRKRIEDAEDADAFAEWTAELGILHRLILLDH